ncbi:MAG: flagellar assembly protein FliW [Lachnospiraceae bacterium]|nr:flagellar assembly protein FliW [Lachnospiraceae bacterium]
MKFNTRLFGEVDIAEDKVLSFENGIIGLENLKKFTLIYDSEKEDAGKIIWLQSLEEETYALPVINPRNVMKDYNPVVDDELLAPLGEFKDEDLMILVTIRVPENIEDMTANLRAPIVINADNRKACQIVAQNEDYMVKQPVYEMLKAAKERAGE